MPEPASAPAVSLAVCLLCSAVRQKEFFDFVAIALEQHIGAAQIADLLVGPFDHALAFASLAALS
jgi:hypothetical protein